MWRVLAITLGVALGAALVTHTVLAQDPPLPHPPMHGGEMPMPHGAMHGDGRVARSTRRGRLGCLAPLRDEDASSENEPRRRDDRRGAADHRFLVLHRCLLT